jgi:uncharacterized membrane protein (DUF2068 family)
VDVSVEQAAQRFAKRPVGLRLIATFKFAKAVVLIAAGCGALRLLGPGRADHVQDWLAALSLDQDHRLAAALAGRALAVLGPAAPKEFVNFAVGAFVFAALFVVEGVGLAMARRWAEYLTVAVTVSFLPIEVVAAWHRWTILRSGTIVLNVIVVIYLVGQLRLARTSRAEAGFPGPKGRQRNDRRTTAP